MKDPNLIVYNNLILYSIFDELKNIFDFNLKDHENNKTNLLEFINKNPQTLVISSEKINHNLNNLIINKPIKIKQLIEKINITVSKSNFNTQSNFLLMDYYLDINSRFLIKNNEKLKLTEKEVEIIQYLKNSEIEKSPQNLQKNIWKHSEGVETHTVETHIYRLRKKISEKFNDNNFIINNKKGYKLTN